MYVHCDTPKKIRLSIIIIVYYPAAKSQLVIRFCWKLQHSYFGRQRIWAGGYSALGAGANNIVYRMTHVLAESVMVAVVVLLVAVVAPPVKIMSPGRNEPRAAAIY